jgi:hypothetical protein
MSGISDSDRKFKNNYIVNGLARVDIFDRQGVLLVKKDSRIREVHYQRMREEGLIQNQDNDSKRNPNPKSIHYSAPDSIHTRLNKLIIILLDFQKRIITQPQPELRQDLNYVTNTLKKLCDENIFQVLGELYLSDSLYYSYIKPLYIAASLNELVKRYNQYKLEQQITEETNRNLLQAALIHNLGLLISQHKIYNSQKKLTPDQRAEIRRNYPKASALMAEKIGINEAEILDTIRLHNIESRQSTLGAQLLRMPFVYAGIAMREYSKYETMDIINPTREFARLFSENKLDPILGGLFLKINGLAPVGSILLFDSREKAVIVAGPNELNIASSTLRMIANSSGVQLARPGDKFRLDRTVLVQKGMSNHHKFAWNKFSPFVAWEK